MEDVLDSKNGAIKDLQYELARVCKAHNDLLRTYEAKLAAFGVPVEEVGFKPRVGKSADFFKLRSILNYAFSLQKL